MSNKAQTVGVLQTQVFLCVKLNVLCIYHIRLHLSLSDKFYPYEVYKFLDEYSKKRLNFII